MGATGVLPVQHKPELARCCSGRWLGACVDSRLYGHESVDARRAMGTPTNKLRANQHWRDASGTPRICTKQASLIMHTSITHTSSVGCQPQRAVDAGKAGGAAEDGQAIEHAGAIRLAGYGHPKRVDDLADLDLLALDEVVQ